MAIEGDEGRARIDPVPVAELRRTALAGEYDPGVDKLLTDELEYIRRKRREAGRNDLAGLALSGGGIRSATFALGVMQALAEKGVLARMDYLSTVSGGGYIGSALTWLLSPANREQGFGLDAGTFPFGIDAGSARASPQQQAMLDWLRQHGKYLTPDRRITLMSGIAIVLRGVVLNLIVWLPVVVAAMWSALAIVQLAAGFLSGFLASAPREVALVVVAIGLATALFMVFVVLSVGYSLVTVWRKVAAGSWRYRMRRGFEIIGPWLLWPAVALVVVATLPYIDEQITSRLDKAGGPVAALFGLASGLWSFLRSRGTSSRPLPAVVPTIGAGLILYGVALLSFQWAVLLPRDPAQIPPAAWGVLAFALVMGVVVNINYISIHRYYRDRLMELFLADPKTAMAGRTGPAVAASSATLSSMRAPGGVIGPYHIINTNLVLVNSREPRRRLRGGDNFILTPQHCGSSATGWIPTDHFIGGRMTLATAMAISGAAANPNAGSGGVGLTRRKSVSLLMALLNLRLGYWVANPKRAGHRHPPNHFSPGLMQAFGKHHEDAAYIELSDGGHFENLALYELIRRRPKLIILCDGAADPKFGFSDLNSLRRRIAADFGTRIYFNAQGRPDDMIPDRLKEAVPEDAGYATKGDMAERGFLTGRIEYALTPDEQARKDTGERIADKSGILIYLKTTMVDSVSFGVKAYKGAHHDFPDETTADQFFDEEQFDAYRELGRHLGSEMLEWTGLAGKIDQVIENGAWPE